MQRITKVQKDYLERRLGEIKRDKMTAYVAKHKEPEPLTDEQIYKGIKKGTIKLKPMAYVLARCHFHSIYDWFDIGDTRDEWRNAKEEYSKSLDKRITAIMDRVVLSSLDIEAAIEEFKKA